ncbi:MAG: T9SS type A sorting domain-containing protein [Dysgonamonadaceae bacterium]|jgi:hypothetical protein|nr:T9SS type A sorting domain-containing protein [Dysgonamonadaceae bacterium]
MKYLFSILHFTCCKAEENPVEFDEFGIQNEKLRLIQDTARGGAISYISLAGSERNLVNNADEGRYIQQSYYAGNSVDRQEEGQSPHWSPWTWNPIQCGDYARNRAQILETRQTADSTYVKCIPMQWDMDGMYAEAEMEQWTSLDGNVVSVRCRLTCRRTDDIYGENIPRDQEIPAVYPISALNNLYSYFGDAPFTGAAIVNTEVIQLESGFWGRYTPGNGNFPSEKWMAFVDDNGWGLGVYSPQATEFLAGRSGYAGGESTSFWTGYIAPLRVEALMKNSVTEYSYYLVVGTLDEIRAKIYEIHHSFPTSNTTVNKEEKNDLKIYPNPANAQIQITNCELRKGDTIEIFDLEGKLQKSVSMSNNQSAFDLDISSLHQGMYFVSVNSAERTAAAYFIKE